MNNEIEKILDKFKVDNKKIPFAFLRYRGKFKTYILSSRRYSTQSIGHLGKQLGGKYLKL